MPDPRSKDIIALGFENGSEWPNHTYCNEKSWVEINRLKDLEMWHEKGSAISNDQDVY
jgi:hypothetical protein